MRNGGSVELETEIGERVAERLRKLGHRTKRKSGGHGGYQAIMYDAERDIYIGASESRKDGQAAGY